jgi:hypothetical protein
MMVIVSVKHGLGADFTAIRQAAWRLQCITLSPG